MQPARPSGPAPSTGAGPSLRRSGAVLAVATLLANALAYGLVVVLARLLSVEPLGAVGSLVNLSVIGSVPALAVQLVAARVTAQAVDAAASTGPAAGAAAPCAVSADAAVRTVSGRVLRLALVVGALLGVTAAAAAPFAASFLRLDGPAAALLVAVTLPAATLVSAVQGLLQGAQRFAALSAVYVVLAGMRLVGGTAGGWAGRGAADGGPSAVMTGLLAGTVVTVVVGLWLLRGPSGSAEALPCNGSGPRASSSPDAESDLPAASEAGAADGAGPVPAGVPGTRTLVADVVRGTLTTSGLMVLLNVDVLLARHVLTGDASGLYAVGSLFAKAAFWGPAFVSTLLFARMAVERARARAVTLGTMLTVGTGTAAVLGAAALGGPLVRIVGGAAYAPVAADVWLFAALGAALAVSQVLLYARLAVADQWLGAAAWAAAAGICAVVLTLPHPGVASVVGTAFAGAAALAVTGLVVEREDLRRSARSTPAGAPD